MNKPGVSSTQFHSSNLHFEGAKRICNAAAEFYELDKETSGDHQGPSVTLEG